MEKTELILVDTQEEYQTQSRRVKQRPNEPNCDYLLRIDETGKKLRTYVLSLESRLEARERIGTDANLLTLRNALEFYADRRNYRGEEPEIETDKGERARTALAAIDCKGDRHA